MPYHCVELRVLRFQVLAFEPDQRTLVAHLITVVWSAKDCDNLAAVSLLVAILLHFVRANE